MELKNLEKQMNFSFNDIKLLELALTHKSSNISSNNERLEFLGDSLLNVSISKSLHFQWWDLISHLYHLNTDDPIYQKSTY